MKKISDIRFFESIKPNQAGYFPSYLGELYKIDENLLKITTRRFVLKLREIEIFLPEFDHLYLCFTPLLDDDVIQRAERPVDRYHSFYRFIDIGYSTEKFQKLTETKKVEELIRFSVKALSLFQESSLAEISIEQSAKYVLENKESALMLYKNKENAEIEVQILVRLMNTGKYYPIIKIINKKGTVLEEIPIEKPFKEDELRFQFGSIRLGKKSVTINPKENRLAEHYKFDKIVIRI